MEKKRKKIALGDLLVTSFVTDFNLEKKISQGVFTGGTSDGSVTSACISQGCWSCSVNCTPPFVGCAGA